MESCNDYWCEHYGKNNSKCTQCAEKSITKDAPELRVILKRRAVNQMELMEPNKTKGQMR
jgi:hypothetical protein